MSILSEVVRMFEIVSTPKITSREYFNQAVVRWMGGNFKVQFFDLPIPALGGTKLAIRKLKKNSKDGPILKELGEKAKISISQFHAFLSANFESKECFIFYMEGNDGNLWPVRANWNFDDGGWNVNANPVTNPNPWNAGNQVVSKIFLFKNPFFIGFLFFSATHQAFFQFLLNSKISQYIFYYPFFQFPK